MGDHASNRKRQLVSRPLLATLLAIMLVISSIQAWVKLGDHIDNDQQASGCLQGRAMVAVAADPALAPALQKIAEEYNVTGPIVRDYCIEVQVRPTDASVTLDLLAAPTWDTQSAGGIRPAAWVPESSVWAAALKTADADALSGTPDSLVSSPVVLAVRPELTAAVDLNWGQLADATIADGLADFGLSGSLRLAMPQGQQAASTAVAAQAFAAAAADHEGALTLDAAQKPAVESGLEQLMQNPPRPGDGSAPAAVTAIAEADDFEAAETRAVPISEQSLWVSTREDTTARVAVLRPKGATPVLDYPVIHLARDTQNYAADTINEFIEFASKPEYRKLFLALGFRTADATPEATATVDFPKVTDLLPPAEPDAAVAVNATVYRAAAPKK